MPAFLATWFRHSWNRDYLLEALRGSTNNWNVEVSIDIKSGTSQKRLYIHHPARV
jgi:hypothetical protein